jgi:uncharacterized protein (TIGR00288 family)
MAEKARPRRIVPEERLKVAIFIDFDNIQIGVKDTLAKDFDVSLVLESLKERGEVVAKVAYGDWSRAGDQSRQMTQHAIQMVQRSVTPRGDKNGADINLALDALEMAFTRHHINAFAIVGGDSDFMALVEKLKQFDKQVFVIGGREFTSNILQRNCTEFIAYENLLKSSSGDARPRPARRAGGGARAVLETRALSEALPNIQRAIKILADRGASPQLGLLKSTLLQLDSTFSERDYGAGSFLEFMQKVERAGLAKLRRTEGGYVVEPAEGESESSAAAMAAEPAPECAEVTVPVAADSEAETRAAGAAPSSLSLLKQAVAEAREKSPRRPLYVRQVRQRLRALDPNSDGRQYSYDATLDLLQEAQREGWLKLLRDHEGVWRIHPIAATAETAASPPPASEPDLQVEAAPAEAVKVVSTIEPSHATTQEVVQERGGAEAAPELAPPSPEHAPEEKFSLAPEAKPKPRPRRARSAKSPGSRSRRRGGKQKAEASEK